MAIISKPRPITGRAKPDPSDHAAQARAEAAEIAIEDMWVDTAHQRAVLDQIRKYMRVCKATRKRKGAAITGRRLSQHSQAGKSAIAARLVHEVAQEALDRGEEPNPYRVIHINMDQRMSLKMLYQEILNRLGDDFPDQPGNRKLRVTAEQAKIIKGKATDTMKMLEQRIEEWVVKLGVELVIVDEIQRLVTKPEEDIDPLDPSSYLTVDAMDVTKKLQAFLDRGVVPLFLIGDNHSPKFFKLNKIFAARLLKPLELNPLNIKRGADREQFFNFCSAYDGRLRKQRIVTAPTCLVQPLIMAQLITACGGHIGRAARIIQVALPAALERGAASLEAYDLSNAMRDFAIELGWVDDDPFSVIPEKVENVAAVDVSETVDA